MKLHLPNCLYRALIAAISSVVCYSAEAVQIPTKYEQVQLYSVNDLGSYYQTLTSTDYVAFILNSSLDISPENYIYWVVNKPIVSGGNIIIASNQNESLTIRDGDDFALYGFLNLNISGLHDISILDMPVDTAILANVEGSIVTISENTGDILMQNTYRAIYNDYGTTTIAGNEGDISFINNNSEVAGGAIITSYFVLNQNEGPILFSENSTVTGSCMGGAIYAREDIDITHNFELIFENNIASTTSTKSSGGAVYSAGYTIFQNNGDITFIGNVSETASQYSYGGAIYTGEYLTIKNNANVLFEKNSAGASDDRTTYSFGGAIYAYGNIVLSGNDYIKMTQNKASESNYARGGAIYTYGNLSIENNGTVFIDNNIVNIATSTTSTSYYCNGGAIYASGNIYIRNNADVVFMANRTIRYHNDTNNYGGAIYTTGSIYIEGNEDVCFKGNYEKVAEPELYRLRSIYMKPDSSSDKLVLAAGEGKSITFNDSLYMESYSGSSVIINASYTDANGITQKASGNVIFTGAKTEEHLLAIKGTAGTENEITEARRSVLNNQIQVYGGSLQIVDDAVLKGRGITLNAGSYAELLMRNASMEHTGYNVTFNEYSGLHLQGVNSISASKLILENGSSVIVKLDAEHQDTPALTLTGTLQTGQLTFYIDLSDFDGEAETYKLLSVGSYAASQQWTEENITVEEVNGHIISFSDFGWDNNVLTFTVSDSMLNTLKWTNYSGNSYWDAVSENWSQGDTNLAYQDGLVVKFQDEGAGTIHISGTLLPISVLVDNCLNADYYWIGEGCLSGDMILQKKGDGTLSISTSNSYTGGTNITGGKVCVLNEKALGSGNVLVDSASLEIGVNHIDNTMSFHGVSSFVVLEDVVYNLTDCINNDGTLSLIGSFNVDALYTDTIQEALLIDVNGNIGDSGYTQAALKSLSIVNGGEVNTEQASILYQGSAIDVDNDGTAYVGGNVDYSQYLITDGHTAIASVIAFCSTQNGSSLKLIELEEGGELNVDTTVTIKANGGTVNLSSGTINGTVSGNATLAVSGASSINSSNTHTGGTFFNGGNILLGQENALGHGAVITSGDNTLSTSTTVTLHNVIHNNGSLTLNGTYDASALTINIIDSAYVDTEGNYGYSGFLRSNGYSVQIVNGGSVSGNATILHGEHTLTLGRDGYATTGGGISYATYYLNGSDSVCVSVAEKASSDLLSSIIMKGGTLYADANTHVTATGGNIVLSSGTLSGTVSGNASLMVSAEATIASANSHTGGTTFNGATITLGHASALGNGSVVAVGNNKLLTGTTVILSASIFNNGNLTLGGSWDISALKLDTQSATRIDIDGRTGNSGFSRSARYESQVVLGGTTEASNLILIHNELPNGLQLMINQSGLASAGGEIDYSTYYLTGQDSVSVSAAESASESELSNIIMSGGHLIADASASLTATGGHITVTNDSILSGTIADTDITFAAGEYSAEVSAPITGDSSLTVHGGQVTLTGNNNYSGGTVIKGGSLSAGHSHALGNGSVSVENATLDLNDYGVSNDIVLNNSHLIGSGNYTGNLSIAGDKVTIEGGYTLGIGKVLEVGIGGTEFGGNLTLAGGTLLFKGAPLTVDGEVNFTASTATLVDLRSWEGLLTDGLTLAELGPNVTGWYDGCLDVIGMNNLSLDFNHTTGTLTLQIAADIAPEKETITWLGAKGMVWQNGKAGWMNATTGYDAVFVNGSDVILTQPGSVTIVGAVEVASLIVAGDKTISFKADKSNPGRIVGEGSLIKRGNGKLTLNDCNTYSGGTFIEAGTVNAKGTTSFGTGGITLSGGTLNLASKAVANDIVLSDSAIIKGGKKFLGTYSQTSGELMKGSVLNISESASISGGVVNGTLSGVGSVTIDGDVELGLAGKITTDKLLVTGSLSASTKGLVMNSKTSAIDLNGGMLSSKGKVSAASLNLNGGSLSLSGALSVKDLTLGSGTLTLDSAKLTTVKVGNTLTLEGGTTLNFGFSVKEQDVEKGKSYQVFTFKTIDASITDAALNERLGLGTDAATLAFDSKRKAITLTVTDAEAWNEYAESVRNGTWTDTPSEDDVLVESAGVAVASFMLARPVAAEAAVDPLLGKVVDTLVQSTWGTAGASRAFGDTIAARGTHATALADGKAAAWISTMGGSSRIATDGAHAGADYTLTGAAFGMEARLSEKSTIGLAIGNSWGKVSTFSAFPVDQDSTHQGIYGKHILGSSTTLSWMAAHTRTESDANLAGMPCDWTQDALQLDARVDKLFAVSDRTTVSAFVGMQYLATDKSECDGLSTGSLQNLRGEIGVSAAHKATDKAYVYGELSFIGDMVRNNPTATVGDYRSRGANPGRVGLNLSVGASHQLNDSWSLNGSYSLELMQNQTTHSANVGATYSF